jgi:rifampicin phosphotransferase
VSAARASLEREYVVFLDDAAAESVALAGTKAASLARLRGAGFPVPDGVVLTTAGLAAHLAALPEAADDELGSGITRSPLPDDVAAALAAALETYGEAPLAVRSSGVAEDLAGASFAGQYETVLGVRGRAAAVDAVRRCWASAHSRHLLQYSSGRGLSAAPLAVLIQPLLEPDAAGVAFTANPVTGRRDEAVVSAVRGLGERLVSGRASPDEWLVRDGAAVALTTPERAVSAADVLRVAELARAVEHFFGAPQDIEWALQDGELYLLQARPITTLPALDGMEAGEPAIADPAPDRAAPAAPSVSRSPAVSRTAAAPVTPAVSPTPAASLTGAVPDPPPGFWQRADSHYPQPLSAYARSVLLPAANHGFRRMCAEFGLLTETVEEREIGGWVYLRAVPLGGRDLPPPPDWLMKILVRVLPSLRARVRDCVRAVRQDRAGEWIERWHAVLRPQLEARLARLRKVELAALGDAELVRHTRSVNLLLRDSQELHMLLNHSLSVLLADFAFTCRDLLGWAEEDAFEMLLGLSEVSSAPARALRDVGVHVRRSTALQEILEDGGPLAAERMTAADAEFGAAFGGYRSSFGCRTIRYEVADPTLAEMPELILALLRDQLRRGYDADADAAVLAGRRMQRIAEARAILRGRGEPERAAARFERALVRAERAYPVREEHGFFDTMMPLALARHAALEAGRRLAARGRIAQPSDVFLLEVEESCAALESGAPRHELVARRQLERAAALARAAPAAYGSAPVAPPSLAALPPEARFAHEAVLWSYERIFATAASARRQQDARRISGIAASAGTFTGPARIIMDESDFGRISAGDVLVCPITSPVWSVLFPSVGALVTDAGGFLSHSAIIAREYRIPAVVATGNATALLHDGQLVSVDGRAGTVIAH